MYLGKGYTFDTPTGTYVSESFMVKSGEKLLIRGKNYMYGNNGTTNMSCNIYLIDSSGNATTLFSTSNSQGYTTIGVLKSGLNGLYSLKIVMTSYSNWENCIYFNDCKVIKAT
jgi:hypothetical protein